MRHFNVSFVLAPEGIYQCSMDPPTYERFMNDFYVFLGDNHTHPDRIKAIYRACEQPIFDLVDEERTPYLYALMIRPRRWYRDLTRTASQSSKSKRIERFVRCCRDQLICSASSTRTRGVPRMVPEHGRGSTSTSVRWADRIPRARPPRPRLEFAPPGRVPTITAAPSMRSLI